MNPQILRPLPEHFPSLCLLIPRRIFHCHNVHTMVQCIQTEPVFSVVTRFLQVVRQILLPDIPSSVDPSMRPFESDALQLPAHPRQTNAHQ